MGMTIEQRQCFLGGLGYYKLHRKDGSLAIDGIGGPATQQAIYNFQLQHKHRSEFVDLDTDGIWGPETEKALREVIAKDEKPQTPDKPNVVPSGKGYHWINPSDFRCRCGGQYCNGWPAQPHKQTMDLLEKFGEHFGKRPNVHSGLRCKVWNRLQKGSATSKHMYGMAVDFDIPGVPHEDLRKYAEELMPNWGGIGIYDWGIHIDDRPVKGRWDSRQR